MQVKSIVFAVVVLVLIAGGILAFKLGYIGAIPEKFSQENILETLFEQEKDLVSGVFDLKFVTNVELESDLSLSSFFTGVKNAYPVKTFLNLNYDFLVKIEEGATSPVMKGNILADINDGTPDNKMTFGLDFASDSEDLYFKITTVPVVLQPFVSHVTNKWISQEILSTEKVSILEQDKSSKEEIERFLNLIKDNNVIEFTSGPTRSKIGKEVVYKYEYVINREGLKKLIVSLMDQYNAYPESYLEEDKKRVSLLIDEAEITGSFLVDKNINPRNVSGTFIYSPRESEFLKNLKINYFLDIEELRDAVEIEMPKDATPIDEIKDPYLGETREVKSTFKVEPKPTTTTTKSVQNYGYTIPADIDSEGARAVISHLALMEEKLYDYYRANGSYGPLAKGCFGGIFESDEEISELVTALEDETIGFGYCSNAGPVNSATNQFSVAFPVTADKNKLWCVDSRGYFGLGFSYVDNGKSATKTACASY